jgi:HIRAN domain
MSESDVKFDVVGLNHRLLPEQQQALKKMAKKKSLKCELRREPDNAADPNAIKVICVDKRLAEARPMFAGETSIGYLRRETAGVLAQGFDNGFMKVKRCRLTYVDAVHGSANVRVRFLKSPARKPKINP